MNLKDDLLPSLDAIVEHVYGEVTPSKMRRVRHLISAHGFPAKRIGGRLESRKSWIEAYYAEPDSANSASK